MTARNIVIDKDILGWAKEHEKELLKQYNAVKKVGEDPDLPQRSFDATVASYCKKNNCDLLTSDKNAYVHFFETGVTTIQISRYDYYATGDRPVYLIRIGE